jgi:hypothetical protein
MTLRLFGLSWFAWRLKPMTKPLDRYFDEVDKFFGGLIDRLKGRCPKRWEDGPCVFEPLDPEGRREFCYYCEREREVRDD